MTDVHISKKPAGGEALMVDGFDLSPHLSGGYSIERRESPDYPTLVHVTLVADTLKVD